jgi:hypothetical protein
LLVYSAVVSFASGVTKVHFELHQEEEAKVDGCIGLDAFLRVATHLYDLERMTPILNGGSIRWR